ncbi:pilus assembly protein TadG-related protein [Agreia sp. VKM Ac-1783]|uniref:pilus assembly protein TadG-related protein n=1 Tax=Agreia sp. VKM Ac-1783 TaxID=1938889 RepID=UPI000A2AA7BE|nr:pilus assembly protein TadG-related protein [Agreia sp. VKM Ac-1783]SMQ68145.1 Putative Flp pilus-assembly TadE/G-like [Agreia sp. VKM Ac-1783]
MRASAAAERVRSDEGSTLPLTIFYAALALLVVLVVVAASSLYLERTRLFTMADGAALAGAESFSLDDVELVESAVVPRLDPQAVDSAVGDYLANTPSAASFDDLAVIEATTPDGRSATVTLSATWRPAVLALVVPNGFPIEVTSIARSTFR